MSVMSLALVACAGPPREPFNEGEHPPPLVGNARVDGTCPRLRVLTFNAFSITFHDHHEELTRLGASAVVAENADVVAIQEVWHTRDADVYAEALHAAGLVHQLQHTTDAVLARGSSGLLLASRFPITDKRFVPFRSAAAPSWMWPPDWYANKGVLEVVIDTETGPLRVLDVHVHAEYEPGGYLRERLGQSLELSSNIRARPELPVLVLGDMNSQPDEVSHAVITQGSGADVVARSDVDLILARDGEHSALSVVSARYAVVQRVRLSSGLWSRLSDHAGVLASVEHCAASGRPRPPVEVEGVQARLREAIDAAHLQGVVAKSVCAFLGLFVVMWVGRLLRRRRRLTRYAMTPVLFALWLMSWAIYQGWLVAPQQSAAYQALLS